MTLIPACLRSYDAENYGASFSRGSSRVAANPHEDRILQNTSDSSKKASVHAGSRQLAP